MSGLREVILLTEDKGFPLKDIRAELYRFSWARSSWGLSPLANDGTAKALEESTFLATVIIVASPEEAGQLGDLVKKSKCLAPIAPGLPLLGKDKKSRIVSLMHQDRAYLLVQANTLEEYAALLKQLKSLEGLPQEPNIVARSGDHAATRTGFLKQEKEDSRRRHGL